MFLSLLVLISHFGIAQEKVDIEKYFEALSTQERSKYVQISETLNPDWNPLINTTDVLAELSRACDIEYKRDINGTPQIPVIECDYKPATADNPLDGSTPKFKCQFDVQGKKKSLKVKYSLASVDKKEIPQAIVTASLARLMGFYADTYCPAIVRCKGCSPDPWQDKSQGAIIPDAVVDFKNTVIERKLKGHKISVQRKPNDKKPLGLAWDELKKVPSEKNKQEREALLAQREALMLFNTFVYHSDADPHNNRLACVEWVVEGTRPSCTKVAAFTHDMGDTFKKMDAEFYFDYKPLSSSCRGNLEKGEGAIVKAQFSNEARNLFLDRFDRVSDNQLKDLLELAQIRKISGTPEEWIQVLRSHANSMRGIKCPSLDSKKSVLGK